MNEPSKDATVPSVDDVVIQPCTECGETHAFPVPKFKVGQEVRLVSGYGFNHNDRVGQVTRIVAVESLLVMPCDDVQYRTEFGFGSIREDRLEPVQDGEPNL